MQRKILPIMFLGFITILIMGCGPIANVDISRDGATVDIVLKEEQVARIVQRADMTIEDDESILDSVSSVTFHEGYVAVEGTYTDERGDSKVGGFVIEMGASDGMLEVQITNVTIDNVDPADVAEANRELAAEFAKEAESGEVEFVDVTVTESALQMQIAVEF